MHKKLINEIIHNGKEEDMGQLKNILLELMEKIEIIDHDMYEEIEEKLYVIVYGHHLNEELAHKWVKSMKNKDGTMGGHWSIEQTSQYASKHHKYDWYAVLNMIYSDYYNQKFDFNTYLELARDWFEDSDGRDDKTLKYYFNVVDCSK